MGCERDLKKEETASFHQESMKSWGRGGDFLTKHSASSTSVAARPTACRGFSARCLSYSSPEARIFSALVMKEKKKMPREIKELTRRHTASTGSFHWRKRREKLVSPGNILYLPPRLGQQQLYEAATTRSHYFIREKTESQSQLPTASRLIRP